MQLCKLLQALENTGIRVWVVCYPVVNREIGAGWALAGGWKGWRGRGEKKFGGRIWKYGKSDIIFAPVLTTSLIKKG